MAPSTQSGNTPAPSTPTSTPAPGGPPPVAAPTLEQGLIATVPQTRDEVAALRAQRSELSTQLSSAVGRRERLARELEGTTGANRAGIESRLKLLDERILQLERDIASTGQLIVRSSGQLLRDEDSPPFAGGSMRIDATAVFVVFTLFVLFPLALTKARSLWRGGSLPKVDDRLARENAERLARIEAAVDAMAIEMERVSEGQRFVTRLLADSAGRAKAQLEK